MSYRQMLTEYAVATNDRELYDYATTAKYHAIARRVVAMGAAVFAEL